MENFSTSSPVPPTTKEPQQLTFPEAIKAVIEGEKITRIEWHNDNIYGLLKDGFLMLHIMDEFKQWIVNDGDLLATDWVVIPSIN